MSSRPADQSGSARPTSPVGSFYAMSDDEEGGYNTITHLESGRGVKLLFSKSKVRHHPLLLEEASHSKGIKTKTKLTRFSYRCMSTRRRPQKTTSVAISPCCNKRARGVIGLLRHHPQTTLITSHLRTSSLPGFQNHHLAIQRASMSRLTSPTPTRRPNSRILCLRLPR